MIIQVIFRILDAQFWQNHFQFSDFFILINIVYLPGESGIGCEDNLWNTYITHEQSYFALYYSCTFKTTSVTLTQLAQAIFNTFCQTATNCAQYKEGDGNCYAPLTYLTRWFLLGKQSLDADKFFIKLRMTEPPPTPPDKEAMHQHVQRIYMFKQIRKHLETKFFQ